MIVPTIVSRVPAFPTIRISLFSQIKIDNQKEKLCHQITTDKALLSICTHAIVHHLMAAYFHHPLLLVQRNAALVIAAMTTAAP